MQRVFTGRSSRCPNVCMQGILCPTHQSNTLAQKIRGCFRRRNITIWKISRSRAFTEPNDSNCSRFCRMLGDSQIVVEERCGSLNPVCNHYLSCYLILQFRGRILDHIVAHQFGAWSAQMEQKFDWMDYKSKLALHIVSDQRFRSDAGRNGGFRYLELATHLQHTLHSGVSSYA